MSRELDRAFMKYIRKKDPELFEKVQKASEENNISYLNAFDILYPNFNQRTQLEKKLKEIQAKIKQDHAGEAQTIEDKPSETKTIPAEKIPLTEEEKEINIFAHFQNQDEKPDPLGSMLSKKTEINSPEKQKKYEIIKKLGEGGMGIVYKAKDHLGREVALKKLKKMHEQLIKRFIHEGKTTAHLQHPGTPPVHDFIEEELTLDMEYVRGENLLDIIQNKKQNKKGYQKKYNTNEMLRIFIKACEAVAYAHSKGTIHRDIKPENIMVGQFGEVKVMDWGLAKQIGSVEDVVKDSIIPNKQKPELTLDGSVMGTPYYMAPEQAEGQLNEIDKQSDIYSLGATLFQMLTYKPAFEGKNAQAILHKVILGQRKKMTKQPKELKAITEKAMALEKENRYTTAEDLIQDVQAYLDGEKISVCKYGLLDNIKRTVKKYPTQFIASGIVSLALLIGGGIAANADRQAATAKAKTAQVEKEKVELERKKTEDELSAVIAARKARDKSNDLIQEGYIYHTNEEYDKAIEIFTEAIKADETFGEAYFNRSSTYRKIGEKKKALDDALEATKRNPENTLYRSLHAHTLEESGDIENAEDEFKKIISEYFFKKLYNTEKSEQVQELFSETNINPLIILNIGSFYSRRNNPNKALEYYKVYAKIMPTDGRAYRSMANEYNTLKDYKHAKENATKAIKEVEKKDFKAYYELGAAMYSTGKYDKAEEYLKKAREHRNDRNKEIDFMLNELDKL
ncbi:protein kinase, partial [Candidatus Woesearchaeota archaeon]|nr:protein kinase [Candidatus Woesearchaeota archaeon]